MIVNAWNVKEKMRDRGLRSTSETRNTSVRYF